MMGEKTIPFSVGLYLLQQNPQFEARGDFNLATDRGAKTIGAAGAQLTLLQSYSAWCSKTIRTARARDRGKRALAVEGSLLSRWVRIFSVTTGSSRLGLPASPYLLHLTAMDGRSRTSLCFAAPAHLTAMDGGNARGLQEQSLPCAMAGMQMDCVG